MEDLEDATITAGDLDEPRDRNVAALEASLKKKYERAIAKVAVQLMLLDIQ
jgi:hypothetical protein